MFAFETNITFTLGFFNKLMLNLALSCHLECYVLESFVCIKTGVGFVFINKLRNLK